MEAKTIRKALANIMAKVNVTESPAYYSPGKIISVNFDDTELGYLYIPNNETLKITHYADNTEYKSYDREELLNGNIAKDILPGILYEAAIRSFEEKKENES